MKQVKINIRLIDVLPTVFGIIAAVGILTFSQSGIWAETMLSPIMCFGGGALTLTIGLVSVVNAWTEHTFRAIHVLNLLWVLATTLYLCFLVLIYFVHPLRFTF